MLDLSTWHDALIAVAAAAGTLAGLILAAMSVNITSIIAVKTLPARAAATIGSLVAVLVLSIAALIPDQTYTSLGIEVLVGALATFLLQGDSVFRLIQDRANQHFTWILPKAVLATALVIPLVICAVLLLTQSSAGLDWLIIASLVIFIGSVVNAWVLLVEIRR